MTLPTNEIKIMQEIEFTKSFVSNCSLPIENKKFFTITAGNLYSLKNNCDLKRLLSLCLYKEKIFINEHYDEIYLKRLLEAQEVVPLVNIINSSFIMFTGEVVLRNARMRDAYTGNHKNFKSSLYYGFLVGEQKIFIGESAFRKRQLLVT